MNEQFDDNNFDIYTRLYFNIEDFMRRVGIKEEELQVATAPSDYPLDQVFCTAVFDDYQALSDLLFKEYEFRIPELVLTTLCAGTILDLLYRTDKNTSMFEKAGELKEKIENDPHVMRLRNLGAFNRTIFDDEEYTELSLPASSSCGDVYDTELLSKELSVKFNIQIMPKVLKYLSVITLLDIVYNTNDNIKSFLDINKKYFIQLQKNLKEELFKEELVGSEEVIKTSDDLHK